MKAEGMRKRRTASVAALGAVGLVALFLSGCSPAQTAATTAASSESRTQLVDTVTVNGTGRQSATPDEGVITIGVQNEATEAAEALNANSLVMAAVLEAIKGAGVSEEDITTTNVSLYPMVTYDPQTGEQKNQGYRAENRATVRLSDTTLVAKVLEVGTAAGANTINGPQWRLSDSTAAASDALVKALASARAKAEALATAAGVRLGDVVLISEGYSTSPVLYAEDRSAEAALAQAVPVSPGQVEIEATVTATYRLVR